MKGRSGMKRLKRRDLFWLLLAQALALWAVMLFQHSPGYMDADYYTVMGRQLARGSDAEPFIWNFLDDPTGLPHPGFAYWQPLPAMLASAGMRVWGMSFAAARLPFAILALFVPWLTALLAFRLTERRDLALLSGALAVASGFYLPYSAVPESFTPLMVLGALFFLLLLSRERNPFGDLFRPWRLGGRIVARFLGIGYLPALALGLVVGMMWLTRAEGWLWLLAALAALAIMRERRLSDYAWVLVGCFLLVFPWMLRNLREFGSVFAPGGLRTLWLTDYNEIFVYPASKLNFAHWWASGLRAILRARMHASATNLLSAFAVQGEVIWLPFILLGAWALRRKAVVRIALAMELILWLVFSLVFPFSGERGGFFHACAALQPLWWALAPLGLARALKPLAKRRRWNGAEALKVLGWGFVGVALLLTVLAVHRRVIGNDPTAPVWDKQTRLYVRFSDALRRYGASGGDVVLVNNPPGFTLATGFRTVVIPDGGVEEVTAVAKRYGARYWVLEVGHPPQLNHYYCHPDYVPKPWRYLGDVALNPLFVLEGER